MKIKFAALSKQTLLACTALLIGMSTHAADELVTDRSSSFSIGFDIGNYANNFGGGITLGSPYFAHDKMHFQLSTDMAWAQGIQNGSTQSSWVSYGLFKLGIYGGHFIENLPIRIYGGGGLLVLTPRSSLSSSSVAAGGFGVTGIEFFVNKARSKGIYIELGGMGSGATADQLTSAPSYASGFSTVWGCKYYL